MNSQEAIKILNSSFHLDCSLPEAMKELEARRVAISALERQIEIENAQFTHICQSNKELYPTTFSIYARVTNESEDSVEIERFQKFGALPIGKITISRKDFERYYRKIEEKE